MKNWGGRNSGHPSGVPPHASRLMTDCPLRNRGPVPVVQTQAGTRVTGHSEADRRRTACHREGIPGMHTARFLTILMIISTPGAIAACGRQPATPGTTAPSASGTATPAAAGCHGARGPAGGTFTITAGQSGESFCVSRGSGIFVYLAGTPARRWTPIRSDPGALERRANGHLALGVTGAYFAAVRPGTARLYSSRAACGPGPAPSPARPVTSAGTHCETKSVFQVSVIVRRLPGRRAGQRSAWSVSAVIRAARDEVLEPGHGAGYRLPVAFVPGDRPGQLPGAFPVPPARPDGPGPGQPDGAGQGKQAHVDAQHAAPDLSLQQADDREGQVDGQDEDDPQEGLQVRRPRRGGDAQRDPAEKGQAAQGRGDEDDLDRQASSLAPVNVLQEQDEGELVQHQRHADAKQGGGDSRPRRAGVLDGETADPADAHENQAEDRVVDVRPARRDVTRPPPHVRADHPDAETDEQERRDEGDEEAEQPQPPGVDD